MGSAHVAGLVISLHLKPAPGTFTLAPFCWAEVVPGIRLAPLEIRTLAFTHSSCRRIQMLGLS